MIPKLMITQNVYERIEQTETEFNGTFYGIMFSGKLCIVGMNFHPLTDNSPLFYQCLYPAGIDWCGVFKITKNQVSTTERRDALVILKDVQVTSNPVYIIKNPANDTLEVYVVYNDTLKTIENLDVISEVEFKKQFMYIQLMSQIKLVVDIPTADSIMKSLNFFKTELPSYEPMFHFKATDIFLHPSSLDSVPDDMTVQNVYHSSGELICDYQTGEIQGLAQMRLFLSRSPSQGKSNRACTLEETCFDEVSRRYIVRLPIDVLCIAERKRLVQESYGMCMDSLWRWVEYYQFYFSKISMHEKSILPLKTYHFCPKILGHYVTVIYHKDSKENILIKHRSYLHSSFNLTYFRPFFKLQNALNNKLNVPSKILMNVHVGLRVDNVINGSVYLVEGDYEYYHYLLDSFNDKGWGCAYRSLQTVFSWFRCQGYTDRPVPTHKEIQECLVKLGDKPKSFIGSNTWIGSTEISYCLNDMLGVNSMILSVSSGDEIPQLAPQLEAHFRTHKTPIMIGGGNLAHTILGINYNEETGAIRYLILDPHYITLKNEEDLKHIQTKGGVFWKGTEFWSKNCFYNLCLPQKLSCY